MKIFCEKESLLKSVSSVQRAVSKRSTLPILNGVLFYTKDAKLYLKATDLEITMTHESEASVEKEGAVVIPARILGDVVKSLPEGKVLIESDAASKKVNIINDKANFVLNSLPAEDFPKIENPETQKSITIPADSFINITKKVLKSVSTDDTRPILTGVLVAINKEKIRMVSTDSYRLTIGEISLDKNNQTEARAVIPGMALSEVIRTATEKKDIEINIGENQTVFKYEKNIMITRLIEGEFPPYQKLIPEEFCAVVRVEKKTIEEVVSRVSVLAQNNAPIKTEVSNNTMTLSTRLSEVGESKEDIPITKKGEDLAVGYNAGYLLEGLNGIDDETAIIEITSPEKPSLIHGEKKSDYLYLIMPVRL